MRPRSTCTWAAWHAFTMLYMIFMACVAAPASAKDDCSLLNSFLQRSGRATDSSTDSRCCLQLKSVSCSNDGLISQLRLGGLGLHGSIANGTLGALRNLIHLDLSNNNLSGVVPPDVWNSSRLQYFDLSANRFNGSVFPALWSLSNVTYVNLSSNGFHGGDDSIGEPPRGHHPLQTLDLSANLISGSLWGNLCTRFANLTVLNISSNRIESGSFSQCTNLQILNASFNQLHGVLLSNISPATSLKILDLKRNSLNGTIPHTLRQLSNLSSLDLSFNNLTGDFDVESLGGILFNLAKLNISHNQLTVHVNRSVRQKFGVFAFANNKEIGCTDCSPAPGPAPTPSLALPPLPVAHKASSTLGAATIAGIVVGGAVGIIAVVIVSIILCRRRRRTKWALTKPTFPFNPDRHIPEIGPFSFETDAGTWVADVKDPTAVNVIIFEKPLLNLTFADLLQATSSFDREAEVGDGAGLVYKCVLPGVLSGEGSVAIKVVEERQNSRAEEVVSPPALEAIGKMKHENLVPLLGYCTLKEEKLLIYKYMDGGSLEEVLHALPRGVLDMDENYNMDWEQVERGAAEEGISSGGGLSWERRVAIAVGIARALAFLHHGWAEEVVHGGVSAASILLEEGGEARLANYGGETGRSRRGEPGYVAPECRGGQQAAERAATTLSDVYSFGVVLLELATGKRTVGDFGHGCASLVAWVRQLTKEKRAACAVDPRLGADGVDEEHVLEMIKTGYLCTAESAAKRPSMQQVVGLLKDLAATCSSAPG